jgi:hypothetical protein
MVDDIATLDWASVPQDGRLNVLVSTRRARYGAGPGLAPDLHIALWNPYQALDVAGPTLLSWGFAPGALAGRRPGWKAAPKPPAARPRGWLMTAARRKAQGRAGPQILARRRAPAPYALGAQPVLRAGPAVLRRHADRRPDVQEHGRGQRPDRALDRPARPGLGLQAAVEPFLELARSKKLVVVAMQFRAPRAWA